MSARIRGVLYALSDWALATARGLRIREEREIRRKLYKRLGLIKPAL